jgi:hypothetical protein
LGLESVQTCAACFNAIELYGRIDFGKQVAFGDDVANFDMQDLELPGHLCTDVNERTRLQESGCRNGIFDIAHLDGCE